LPPELLQELVDRYLADLRYSAEELAVAVNANPVRFRGMHRLQMRHLKTI
jgi:hypothetical protein